MISCSIKLSHPEAYRDDNYSYSPIEGEKDAYGKATFNGFKPRELTEDLLLTPDQALCMATFYPNPKISKKGKEYNSFSRADSNVSSIDSWMALDLDEGLPPIDSLDGYTYFLVTTQNHGATYGDRYKLFIKTNLLFTEDLLQYYKSAYEEVANRLNITNFDSSCTDISRLIAPLALEGDSTTIVAKGIGDKDFSDIDLTTLPATTIKRKTKAVAVDNLVSKITTSRASRTTLNKTATTAFVSQGMYPDDTGTMHHTLEYLTNPALRPLEPDNMARARAVAENPTLYKALTKADSQRYQAAIELEKLPPADTSTTAQKTRRTKLEGRETDYKVLKQEFKLAVDAQIIPEGEQAFQPLEIIEESSKLVARAQGQHSRNTECSLVMNIDVKSVSSLKPFHTEVLTTDKTTYYYDSKKLQLVTLVKEDLRFFPEELFSPEAVISSFADLYRVGDESYMLEGTNELITAQDLLRIIEVQYGDIFIHGYDEEGKKIPASVGHYAPSVMKFINEELPANRRVNGIREVYSYNPPRTFIDSENFYIVQKSYTMPTEPKLKTDVEITDRIEFKFPDLEASIRMAVLGGYGAEGKYSKTFISLLNGVSDAGKNVLLINALTNIGLVKKIPRPAFVDTFIENGPGGTDPKSLENALIVIINEANSSPTAEEKMMDALKDAHEYGINGRTLHAKNIHMVLNQVWLISAQTLSFSLSPHYEHATRMTNFRWRDNVYLPDSKIMQGLDLDTQVRPALEQYMYDTWLDEYSTCRTMTKLEINERASNIQYNMEARKDFLKTSKAVEIRSIVEMAGLALQHHTREEIAGLTKLEATAPNQQRPYYEFRLNPVEDKEQALFLSADFRIAFKSRRALGEYIDNGGGIGKNTAKNIVDKLAVVSENLRTKTFGGHPVKCIGILSLDKQTFLSAGATDKIRATYPDIQDAYAAYDDNLESVTAEQWTKLVMYYIEESDKIEVVTATEGGLDV